MFESNYIYLWILINVQNKNLSVFFLSVKSERKRVMEVLEVSWAFTEERVQNNLTVNEVLISSSWITVIKGVKQITRVFSSVTTVSDGWMMVKWSWRNEGTTQYDVWQQQEELMINRDRTKLVTTHSFIIT